MVSEFKMSPSKKYLNRISSILIGHDEKNPILHQGLIWKQWGSISSSSYCSLTPKHATKQVRRSGPRLIGQGWSGGIVTP